MSVPFLSSSPPFAAPRWRPAARPRQLAPHCPPLPQLAPRRSRWPSPGCRASRRRHAPLPLPAAPARCPFTSRSALPRPLPSSAVRLAPLRLALLRLAPLRSLLRPRRFPRSRAAHRATSTPPASPALSSSRARQRRAGQRAVPPDRPCQPRHARTRSAPGPTFTPARRTSRPCPRRRSKLLSAPRRAPTRQSAAAARLPSSPASFRPPPPNSTRG
jgi:hypothetical protein